MTDLKTQYPEHYKLLLARERIQDAAEFMEWLRVEKQLRFGKWATPYKLEPVNPNIGDLLAEFFDIDLKKIEQEDREMLGSMRENYKGETT
jgi:hypothetical protein